MINSTIRTNKPLLFDFLKKISLFWSSICAKVSVCGFLASLHCAVSSPKKFVCFFLGFFFFLCSTFFFFSYLKTKHLGLTCLHILFNNRKSWICSTSSWVSGAQLFFMILTFTGWFVQQLTFLQAEKSSNGRLSVSWESNRSGLGVERLNSEVKQVKWEVTVSWKKCIVQGIRRRDEV